MNFGQIIKQVAHGEHDAILPEDAHALFSAMLDGGGGLELGALLTGLRMKTESAAELLGLYRAVSERLYRCTPRGQASPLVIPAYGGARTGTICSPAGTPLRRLGVPVCSGSSRAAGRGQHHILRGWASCPARRWRRRKGAG